MENTNSKEKILEQPIFSVNLIYKIDMFLQRLFVDCRWRRRVEGRSKK